MTDPAFLTEADRIGIEINPVGSDDVYEILRQAYSMPPAIVAAAKEAMNLRDGG